MIKDILFKMATPLACAISVALTPIGISADQYYYDNSGDTDCCCDPCQNTCCENNNSGWIKTAAVFIGAAAIGAVAGVASANSNKHHHHRRQTTTTPIAAVGPVGPQGPAGPVGARGPAGPEGSSGADGTSSSGKHGAGFDAAFIPQGQANAGEPITSLTFAFTTLGAVTAGPVKPFVTTPDGRTIVGSPISGDVGSTGFVTVSSGPFHYGRYDVGLIIEPTSITRAGLVSAEIININGNATSPALDNAGISVPVGILSTETFFTAPYPFPEVP